MMIKGVTMHYADGSSEDCSQIETGENHYMYKCVNGIVTLRNEDGVVSLSASTVKPLSSLIALDIWLDLENDSRILVLTTHPDAGSMYASAFAYYNKLAIGESPSVEKPPDNPDYPPRFTMIDHFSYIRRFPCWSYPVIIQGFDEIPLYSIFAVYMRKGEYIILLPLLGCSFTVYLGPGPRLMVFTGREVFELPETPVLIAGKGLNLYRVIEETVAKASRITGFRLRREKRLPVFMNGLGWCSWNAFLTTRLTHDNVVTVVSRLLGKDIPLKWVLIDDGWQDEEVVSVLQVRALKTLNTDRSKFPRGLSNTVSMLKNMGIRYTGLWHTINIHWGGAEEEVFRELGSNGYRSPVLKTLIPQPELGDAYRFYKGFYKWVGKQGFNFVKVDNQWSIHALYLGDKASAEASRSIELALQLAAEENGLEVLNCMSMVPENYYSFLLSNAVRTSIDYVPFWRGGAKLHAFFNVYNSLLFSHIAYPDYDMWVTYDPYARLHAVLRVFSGGPVYITDGDPDRTDRELLGKIVLPDGSITRVDEPGLPTLDIVFRDPYNEEVLLKIASKIGFSTAIALFNINRNEKRISDKVTVDTLPYITEAEAYAYYKVFTGETGVIDRSGEVHVELEPLGVEVLILSPIINNKAVIGLENYLLPPATVESLILPGEILVKAKAKGRILYYKDAGFARKQVEAGETVKI